MTRPAPPTPPPAKSGPVAGGGSLSRWVRTHQGQAAAIAGVAAVAAYALYKRRQNAAANPSTATTAGQSTGTLAPYYDPTTGQYIDPVSGMPVSAPSLTGYSSPAVAGGMPSGDSTDVAAQLAALEGQVAALSGASAGYGQPGTTPPGSTAPGMTAPAGSPAVHPPLYYGMASTPAQARALDPNIGASSAADAAYLAGGTAAVQRRIAQIATNRGVTLTSAQLGALANRALQPAGSSGYLNLDQIRSQIDRGGSAY